jgi:hypothetical protein
MQRRRLMATSFHCSPESKELNATPTVPYWPVRRLPPKRLTPRRFTFAHDHLKAADTMMVGSVVG